ncbi:MAG: DUF885 domain-containing protein [Lachnospiraceae bacterium]|nr:DUF885 domain-containing protein [Lachnospiraceae bacterium]
MQPDSRKRRKYSGSHRPEARPEDFMEASGISKRDLRPHPVRLFLPGILAAVLAVCICHFITNPPVLFLSEEQKFVAFTEEVFRNELSGNTLNLHYLVADPAAYGLEDCEASIGSASTESLEEAYAQLENYRAALLVFDYEELSDQRKLTYDVFLDYLDTELESSALLLYDEPLGPTLGVQAQLPVLLAEYAFRTKGDIEDYLTLLSQIPDYFESILSFEQDKSEAGLFMSSDCALAVIEQCLDFVSDTENHYLIETFDEKIDAVSNLTADEKIAYKARNKSVLTGYVFPAYQALAASLAELEGSGTNEMGLYYYPEGRAYYEYLVKSMVGDDRAIEEIEEAIKTQVVSDYAAMQELLAAQVEESGQAAEQTEGTTAEAEGTMAEAEGTAAMLEDLRSKINNDFPLLPSVSYEIKYVHESLQDYLSPAFYLTPAIDNYTENVIYINPASDYSGLELYTTLAHEGYPGHLYQSVYFASQSPDLLRYLLDVGGYTEGWATYVEMYAYSLYDGDSDGSNDDGGGGSSDGGGMEAALSQLNRSFTLGVASLLDIGIHYRGYTPEEVSEFLVRLGFSESTADALYEAILESPANYLQYYVGCLNFWSLRDSLEESVDGFSLKKFHQAVLETGPVPFAILEEQCLRKLS